LWVEDDICQINVDVDVDVDALADVFWGIFRWFLEGEFVVWFGHFVLTPLTV
jgi:hypothetical protein